MTQNQTRISDNRADVDFAFVHGFLAHESIWATDIGAETLKRALDHSLCISAFRDEEQVGFARAVTDFATYAWIDDVFVKESERGAGIARRLLEGIVSHESLAPVASWWLSSSNPHARALFQKIGFEEPPPERAAKLMARPKAQGEAYRR